MIGFAVCVSLFIGFYLGTIWAGCPKHKIIDPRDPSPEGDVIQLPPFFRRAK